MKLKELSFKPYTTREIHPEGWLQRQLEIQAKGLSGNLDKIWPDIRDSRWIGGDREGWERVPYWLDGFIPLAYLVDNPDMQQRAKRYIDSILANQQEDGWICPCTQEERNRYDMWALFLICKVLVVYHDCTQDERIEEAVYRALRQFNQHINGQTIFNWAASRWFECLIPLFWLYERRPEKWMIDLCYKLYAQGVDYGKLFDCFRFQQPDPHGVWTYLTHVVNLAMALKADSLMGRLTGKEEAFGEKALGLLQQYHGMPTGHFTGDECLSGTSPVQGSECCGVAEAMYSYEQLLAVTGKSVWGDWLEKLAFNAFPATVSPDMWSHQYDQMTNQVQCSRLPEGVEHFRTNGPESHLFGLEPNFGCCTANFNQAFPKFALSVFMQAKDGIAITALAPCTLQTTVKGVAVRCTVETQYPFRDSLTVSIQTAAPVTFTLYIRIPGYAKEAVVDGQKVPVGNFCPLERRWTQDKVEVSFTFQTTLQQRPSGMVCVERGPLLYSVAIEEEWRRVEYADQGVERLFPYCDYEIYPKSKWNYGLVGRDFTLHTEELGAYPFSPQVPPVWLEAQMAEIDWPMKNDVCTEKPRSTTPLASPESVRLIPYGCTNLRLTEFPMLD